MTPDSALKPLQVDVEGVGRFLFKHRPMAMQFAIDAEFQRLTGGDLPRDTYMGQAASCFADLKVLTLQAPVSWSLDALDPYVEDDYRKLIKVWEALRTAEDTFRGHVRPQVEGAGEGSAGADPDAVPASVQPGAD